MEFHDIIFDIFYTIVSIHVTERMVKDRIHV